MEKKRKNILDEYLEKYDRQAEEQEDFDLQNVEEAYAFFEDMKQGNIPVPVVFDLADVEGNLLKEEENGLSLILPKKEIGQNTYRVKGCVGDEINCYVDKIDRESNKVYFRNLRRHELRERIDIDSAIRAKMERQEEVIVYGVIKTILNHGVIVSIYGSSVTGYCPINEWNKGYTHNMDVACKQDGIRISGNDKLNFKFRVLKKQQANRSYRPKYILSHKEFTRDPWENFPADIKKDSVLVLSCVAKPNPAEERKQYWWGISKRIKGIDVLCDNNERFEIKIGCSYKCRITRVDLEERKISASPFEQAENMTDYEQKLENLIKQSFNEKMRREGV